MSIQKPALAEDLEVKTINCTPPELEDLTEILISDDGSKVTMHEKGCPTSYTHYYSSYTNKFDICRFIAAGLNNY